MVYDSADLNPVTDCTLALVELNNSIGLSLTNSDKKGKFKLILPKAGIFQLIFTHTGYETRKITIQFTDDNQPIDLGIINLKRLYKQLQDIIITEKFQSSIKGGTIIFNTNELITKPYVTPGGILNKLPGFQLQRDGSIMAMGTIVQKIFVDGQEFFANDPRLATRNITADMIDQIQVYEDKSEQAKFSKIDDGIRIKTINIKLKKDKAKGDFGRITAAPATENRYEAGIFVNHFRAKSRISLTATSGNSNKNSYSFISQNSGNASGNEQDNQNNAFSQSILSVLHSESINPGMLKINKTSISYNDDWSTKINITGNYSFVNNENILEQTSNRYNQFPNDSSSEVLKQFKTQTINYQHVLNARWNVKSMLQVQFIFNR